MGLIEASAIIKEYMAFIKHSEFPCISAKAAMMNQNIKYMVADHMACPKDDLSVLKFLYNFVDDYRKSDKLYHSAVIIFQGPEIINEEVFDKYLWDRLQSLANLDSQNYKYDSRVSSDPSSARFSFSIKEEAFYIIGLHPLNTRQARKFIYPAMVFNPHAQFEQLRKSNKYESIKRAVRKRDIALCGSINPMLTDFGHLSEVFQYSGRKYDSDWECPLQLKHSTNEHNSST